MGCGSGGDFDSSWGEEYPQRRRHGTKHNMSVWGERLGEGEGEGRGDSIKGGWKALVRQSCFYLPHVFLLYYASSKVLLRSIYFYGFSRIK